MTEISVNFSGKWKLSKTENFDEFASAVGMPWIARKMAGKASPEMVVEHNGTHFKVTMKMMMMTNVNEFNIGEEFIFEPPKSGQKMKSIGRFEGDKLVVDATPVDDSGNVISQTTTRELNGHDESIVTTTVKCKDRENTVTMKRYFTRVK